MDINHLIERAGGVAVVARACQVSTQAVSQWKSRGTIPAERVISIERATVDPETGVPRVTRYELRPDLYPLEEAA